MKKYEAIFIINPDLNEGDLEKALSRVQDVIASKKGAVENIEKWGKKKLAYPVKKAGEGFHFKVDFSADPASIEAMAGAYRLDVNLIRSMIVRKGS